MIKVSIIGATGYTGSELMRLLVNHPEVELMHLTARELAGGKISHTFPFLTPYLKDKCFEKLDIQLINQDSDLVFICLPHGHAMSLVKELDDHIKVIDLGADFRIKDTEVYEEYYHVEQSAPEYLEKAVYGLSEYYRDEIKDSQLIANPGCFVTSALLALLPLVRAQVIEVDSIIIDSKTGVSGAGRGANVANLITEAGNNLSAYNPLFHRHIPEMEQELSYFGQDVQVQFLFHRHIPEMEQELSYFGQDVQVQFTPHLLPTERGIHSTIYAKPSNTVTEEALRQIFQDAYEDEDFVHLLDPELLPSIKSVRGSNHCYIQVKLDPRTDRIIIFSALDNLVKGASGQAIQNMNILYGFPESMGLTQSGLMP